MALTRRTTTGNTTGSRTTRSTTRSTTSTTTTPRRTTTRTTTPTTPTRTTPVRRAARPAAPVTPVAPVRATRTATSTRVATRFRPRVLSRHPSHRCLRPDRGNLPFLPWKSVIRLGSTTPAEPGFIEINSIQSVRNSSCKLLMKECFTRAGVRTAPWRKAGDITGANTEGLTFSNLANRPTTMEFPVVGKKHYGSKGNGNTLIKTLAEYNAWRAANAMGSCIIEKFMPFSHEFRLHITSEGCFYACRKAIKSDCPEDQKWRHHDDTCVWLLETNPNFHRPNTWNAIVRDCVAALGAIGADVLSFDVKVQSNTVRGAARQGEQDYILLECNSASSMDNGSGELSICAQKYIEEIPRIITRKANNR